MTNEPPPQGSVILYPYLWATRRNTSPAKRKAVRTGPPVLSCGYVMRSALSITWCCWPFRVSRLARTRSRWKSPTPSGGAQACRAIRAPGSLSANIITISLRSPGISSQTGRHWARSALRTCVKSPRRCGAPCRELRRESIVPLIEAPTRLATGRTLRRGSQDTGSCSGDHGWSPPWSAPGELRHALVRTSSMHPVVAPLAAATRHRRSGRTNLIRYNLAD